MAPKYQCSLCKNSFYKGMIIDSDAQVILCLPCDLRNALTEDISILRGHLEDQKQDHLAEIGALKVEISQLKVEIDELKSAVANSTSPTFAEVVKSPGHSPSEPFKVVKKGPKPSSALTPLSPIPTFNRFSALEDVGNEEENSIVLVGDSMVRNQKHFFAQRKSNRKVFSYSGVSLSGDRNITSKIDQFTEGADSKSSFIIEVGTNDLLNLKRHQTPQKLIENYRSLLHQIRDRTQSNNLCILGLMPVMFESLGDISDRKSINELLSKLAVDEGVKFVSWWNDFAHPPNYRELFNYGGLHLSHSGDIKLGHLLNNLVKNFQRKDPIAPLP